MNREQRAQIRQVVLECRRLLEQEFDELLRLYGILPEHAMAPERLPPERREVRERFDAALAREASQDYSHARQRYLKHAAFTFLNRLLALRMAEASGLLVETVITRPEYGDRSRRERDLADFDPGLAVVPERLAHEALRQAFAEMRKSLPLLFQDDDPYALLLPHLPTYREVRQALGRLPSEVWQEFETLGWAYQYFTDEEREQIRRRLRRNPTPDDVPALNQFYTVGWIVKFLVHNTLGRLWVETHPSSPLRQSLDYLVPIENNFRPPPEPISVRKLKVLDPACGSGHFLLGAFDLLLEMWHEEEPDLPPWQIPSLILEHNLYGVDIDLRACQIAATALYLKARTAFERLRGDDPSARFELRRLNIICADVRFADGERRARFLSQFDRDLRRIVEETLRACEHAFEIGSLLRIRQPFEALFAQRRARLEELRRIGKQLSLPLFISEEQPSFGDVDIPVPKPLTVGEIVDRIRLYIREAAQAQDMGTLLFGLDAERAVYLVDILTEQYDVVLMNPPYGAMPPVCKEYARQHYPRTHSDFYATFIEQAVSLTRPGGCIGALTGRTFLFLKSFQKLREEILRYDALPEAVLDLGFNVLDGATARYAAFTLRKRHPDDGVDWHCHPVIFFRLTPWDWDDKRERFEQTLRALQEADRQ